MNYLTQPRNYNPQSIQNVPQQTQYRGYNPESVQSYKAIEPNTGRSDGYILPGLRPENRFAMTVPNAGVNPYDPWSTNILNAGVNPYDPWGNSKQPVPHYGMGGNWYGQKQMKPFMPPAAGTAPLPGDIAPQGGYGGGGGGYGGYGGGGGGTNYGGYGSPGNYYAPSSPTTQMARTQRAFNYRPRQAELPRWMQLLTQWTV
jgi:hypothetical protein